MNMSWNVMFRMLSVFIVVEVLGGIVVWVSKLVSFFVRLVFGVVGVSVVIVVVSFVM